MGIGINIYFPDELVEKTKILERGQISKICQNALKDYFNLREMTKTEIEAKLREIEYDKQRKEKEKEILRSKLKKLEEKELENKQKEIEDIKNKRQKEKEILNTFVETAIELYNLSDKYAKELYPSFKDSGKAIIPFLDGEFKRSDDEKNT